MADDWTLKGVSREDERPLPVDRDAPSPADKRSDRPDAGSRRVSLLSLAVGLIGLAALGASAWVYAETQREIKRISTDIAQIRVSLELYGRQQPASGSTGAAVSQTSLQDLANRLALLEANQRLEPASTASAAQTGQSGAAAGGGVVAAGGDCLPPGMRFMVAAGDSYAVCGTSGSVDIGAVDDGYVTLRDGTVIAQGGTVMLPETQCMLGLMPGDGDGLSGYAEVRVTC